MIVRSPSSGEETISEVGVAGDPLSEIQAFKRSSTFYRSINHRGSIDRHIEIQPADNNNNNAVTFW